MAYCVKAPTIREIGEDLDQAETSISSIIAQLSTLQGSVQTLQTASSDHETRITALENPE